MLEEYTGGYVGRAAHATLERWPAELLLWRGNRAKDIARRVARGRQLDGADATPALADLALTLATQPGAAGLHRCTLARGRESVDDLRGKLEIARALLAGAEHASARAERHPLRRTPLAADGRVAFLFPGQGSQTVDMARELAIALPEAREAFDVADAVLAGRYEQPLSRYVFPPPAFTGERGRAAAEELTDTHVAQAALGATELAYLRVLAALGVAARHDRRAQLRRVRRARTPPAPSTSDSC